MIIDPEVVNRARHIAERAKLDDPAGTLAYFREWLADDPADGAAVMLVLAVVARIDGHLVDLIERVNLSPRDRERAEREAHAAYCRLPAAERTDTIRRLESAYQARRRRAARQRRRDEASKLIPLQAGELLAQVKRDLPPVSERRAIRVAAGISLRVAGNYCGADKGAVGKWELGIRQPTGERLVRYGEFLHRLRSGEITAPSTQDEGERAA